MWCELQADKVGHLSGLVESHCDSKRDRARVRANAYFVRALRGRFLGSIRLAYESFLSLYKLIQSPQDLIRCITETCESIMSFLLLMLTLGFKLWKPFLSIRRRALSTGKSEFDPIALWKSVTHSLTAPLSRMLLRSMKRR